MSYLVEDVYDDIKKILGACDRQTIYRRISHAVEVLSNSGDFDPLLGYLDICVTQKRCVTLPREVDTILAINFGGTPTIGRDMFFRFHINGPGDCSGSCTYSWDDRGLTPVLQDLTEPSRVVAYLQLAEDVGVPVWVYGYDSANQWVRSFDQGEWKDGYRVPTLWGVHVPDTTAPTFSRVTRVYKGSSDGNIRLSTYTNGPGSGSLLGIYEPDETSPEYRRIQLGRELDWIRIGYRKRVYRVKSLTDLIPLPSTVALLFMVEALSYFKKGDLERGAGHEATARRYLTEAQWAHTPPVTMPIQVSGPTLRDECDDFVSE